MIRDGPFGSSALACTGDAVCSIAVTPFTASSKAPGAHISGTIASSNMPFDTASLNVSKRCFPLSSDRTAPLTEKPHSRRYLTTHIAIKPEDPVTSTFAGAVISGIDTELLNVVELRK